MINDTPWPTYDGGQFGELIAYPMIKDGKWIFLRLDLIEGQPLGKKIPVLNCTNRSSKIAEVYPETLRTEYYYQLLNSGRLSQ